MSFRAIHRYLSLAVLVVWFVQAVTGTLSVFRWEIDESSISGAKVPTEWALLGARVDALDARPDTQVSSVWTSGTSAGRFDVYYSVGDADRVLRVDGAGTSLRDRSGHETAAKGAIWDSIYSVHTSLLAGEAGKWLVGITGMLLFTNILLGLKLAWPKRGTWQRALFGAAKGGSHARLYAWHRKLGLWIAMPALLTVSAGVLLTFGDEVESGLQVAVPGPPVRATTGRSRPIGLARAVTAAASAFPGSTFAGVSLPGEDAPWYRIRVRSAGEVLRKWGASVVYVAADDGRVLARYDAAEAAPGRTLMDTLYPLHTGQIGGLPGRLLLLMVGSGLAALIGLGAAQWAARRKARARSSGARQQPTRSATQDPS